MHEHPITLAPPHGLTACDFDALQDCIYEFNAGQTGCRDAFQLGFVFTLGEEIVGAVAGFT